MKFRNLRLNKLIRKELGDIISREIEIDNTLISITEVRVDKQLEQAHILVSVLPAEKSDTAIAKLNTSKSHLRKILMKRVPMKFFPQIEFKLDRGLENAARVEKRVLEAKRGVPTEK